MRWDINYADKEAMISLQQLMVARREEKSINMDLLGTGEGRTARNYLSPGYLENKTPLGAASISSLMTILDDLQLNQQDFEYFHNNRVASASKSESSAPTKDSSFQQNNSFAGCDFSSAKIISGNHTVNVTFDK